jgi:hypothetical protein
LLDVKKVYAEAGDRVQRHLHFPIGPDFAFAALMLAPRTLNAPAGTLDLSPGGEIGVIGVMVVHDGFLLLAIAVIEKFVLRTAREPSGARPASRPGRCQRCNLCAKGRPNAKPLFSSRSVAVGLAGSPVI